MTIHEQAKAARALANELFKGPCHMTDGCYSRQKIRPSDGKPSIAGVRAFDTYDHNDLCVVCAAYWYAEMAAQTLERTAKLTDPTFTLKDPKETIR